MPGGLWLHWEFEPLRAVEIQDCRTQLIEMHLRIAVGIGEYGRHFLHLCCVDNGNAVTRDDLGHAFAHHWHRQVVRILQ